ncbi:MAG: phosphotransferase [Patescibacteria group bacterium]
MPEINLEKISLLISQKLKEKIEIVDIEKIGSGYHSDGFKLTSKENRNFFLKRVKSHDYGFEIPERKLNSLLVSNGMYRRSGMSPRAIGVVINNQNEAVIMPELDENSEIYHIQEYKTNGASYWSQLESRKAKNRLDQQDLEDLEKITDYICRLHKVKYPSQDIEQLKIVYNDGLRSVITNPELTIMLLHDFDDRHPILPAREHGKYVGLMLNLMHLWKDRYDRLSALHGDFWGANLFFDQDGSIWVIDYSRIPWGDPGLDVGWWLAQYLWLYHETNNEYFKESGEKFLEIYIRKTGDKEIRQAVSLVMGLCGIIYIAPKFYPQLNLKPAKTYYKNILAILKNNQFIWKK